MNHPKLNLHQQPEQTNTKSTYERIRELDGIITQSIRRIHTYDNELLNELKTLVYKRHDLLLRIIRDRPYDPHKL